MSIANVKSKWVSGNLVFKESVAGNDAAIHFGVDDTGLDVKFFGATSGSYMLWDQSADKLIVNAGTADLGTACEADAYTVGGVAGADVSGDGTIDTFTMTAVKGIITAFAKIT
jgi:hypothetical protein